MLNFWCDYLVMACGCYLWGLWLRSNGSVSGNGSSINHLSSSSLRSDDYGTPKVVRKNSSSTNDQNLGRSSASERVKSPHFRRSFSNNGSVNLRTSNIFCKNHHDRDSNDSVYESGNKDRTILEDFRRRDFSDSLGNNSSYRVERKSLRRLHSVISDQRDETLPRNVEAGSKSAYKISNNNVSASAMIRSDKWTSALAEVPGLVKTNGTGVSAKAHALAEVPGLVKTNGTGVSAKAHAPGSPTMDSSISTGLSMAETVAHLPPRVKTTPQLSTESQRQELAIKQSRQLIPVTPSAPKALVPNPPEKPKAKTGQPHLIHSPRGGSAKPDLSKTSSIGKLQVLKPVRERNGDSLPPMDNLSPKRDSRTVSSVPAATHSVAGSSSVRAQVNNSGHPAAERNHLLPLLEKRAASQSQTQSRNDFFSLMRKKSISNSSPAPESGPVISASDKKLGEGEDAALPVTDHSGKVGVLANIHSIKSFEYTNAKVSDGHSCNGGESLNSKKNGSTCNSSFFSEEEEASFLRSLGWEENTEEGGLTDEEINAFYKDVTKYINSKPSWKILQGMPRFLLALESQIGSVAAKFVRISIYHQLLWFLWLRSSGNVSVGTGSTSLRLSSLLSDDHLKSKVVRKNSFSNYDQNIKRSSATERITSSYWAGVSAINGSDKVRTSSSFSRNQRDRDWDGDMRSY
ncbi:hypothetical protein Leryth_007166 [Lithospermum erythrorhizon]|nr:hypothetical protein Leryth_007166 [Lithospermum erythrorhizon]